MLATACCGWALSACVPKAVVVDDEEGAPVAAQAVKKQVEPVKKVADAEAGGLRQPKLRTGDMTTLPTASEMQATDRAAAPGGGGLPVVPEHPASTAR